MQTLVFNTTTKTVKLYEGIAEKSEVICSFENVPTVKIADNYYEVMQDDVYSISDNKANRVPVLRVGIQTTNMLIKK